MNEKRVEQVVQIEKQAQQMLESAKQEAARLPVDAEQEAQALIEKARSEAQSEARKMIAEASSEAETSKILSDADKKIRESEAIAKQNEERAVKFVVDKVLGKA